MAIFDYNPSAITPFPYWRWNKVLPAVYDDSVSQYEMLCRLLSVVNNIIESTNSTGEQVEALTQLVQQLIDGEFPTTIVDYVNQLVDAAMADDIERINAIIDDIREQVTTDISNIQQQIDNMVVTVNNPNDTTADNQNTFINGGAITIDGSITFVDSTRNTRLIPSINNFGYDTNLDFCYLVTLLNSYLINSDKFTYANDYTGSTYTGTYSNPVLCDPREYTTDGRMHIDCATLTTLVSHGIEYSTSSYNGGSNNGYNMMFDPTSEAVKPYWKYNISRDYPNADRDSIGYGRILTDALAKFMHDSGRLIRLNSTENFPIGGVLFSGNAVNRFMNITHCSMIGGYVLTPTWSHSIVVESTNNFTNAVITRPISEGSSVSSYRAAYIPPTFGSLRFSGFHTAYMTTYNFLYKDRNLNSDPITWLPINETIGARVITIMPNTANEIPVTATVKTTAYAINKGFVDKSMTVTDNIHGHARIILPYGWELTSLTSSSSNTTFNVSTQIISTDRDLFMPIRGL